MKFGTEAEVYRLVMKSNTPQAEAFQDWVCGEVLPAIRKSGGYIAAKPEETPEQIMAKAFILAKETIERQSKQLAEIERTVRDQYQELQMAGSQIAEQERQSTRARCCSRRQHSHSRRCRKTLASATSNSF